MFGGNFAPRSWALCEGQLLAISQNTALFSILGTTYGGDGRTTFALPDLRGRTAIGPGNGPGLSSRRQGEKLGSERNVLNVTQIPSHTHAATGKLKLADTAANNIPANSYPAAISGRDSVGGSLQILGWNTAGGATFGAADGVTVTVGNTGGNQSVNNMQPYIAIYYIICLQGIFPSRS